jgi:hypothetical protein
MTFRNWITQKLYYGKWVQYVESFQVADILLVIPTLYRNNYNELDPSSKIKVDQRSHDLASGLVYISAASASSTRQKAKKDSVKSDKMIYLLATTKTCGSG